MSQPADPPGTARRCRVISFVAQTRAGRPAGIASDVGWILATAGHRVLIAEVGHTLGGAGTDPPPRGPSVAAYLAPFPTVERADLDERLRAALGEAGSGKRLSAVTYLFPGDGAALDLLSVTPLPVAAEPAGLAEMRHSLGQLGYDYVLVSPPPDPRPAEPGWVAPVSDVVVMCFPAAESAAREARAAAHRMLGAAGTGRVELLGAASQQAVGDPRQLEQRRRATRQAFAPPELSHDPFAPSTETPAPRVVELPDWQTAADRPILSALFEDQSGTGWGEAYHALVAAVTAGAVTHVPPIPASTRKRYRRRVGAPARADPEEVWVAYAPADLGWAEWVVGELARAGASAALLPGRAGTEPTAQAATFVLLGPDDGFTAPVRDSLQAHRRRSAVGTAQEELRVRLRGATAPLPPSSWSLDLTTVDEPEASARLLSRFILTRPAEPPEPHLTGATWRTRFPGHGPPPTTSNTPPPNRSFAGRERELRLLRAGLLARRVQVLTGPPAAGKSEIAREYANRFGFDYDLVWWFPARDRPSVEASHGRLTSQLNAARARAGQGPLGSPALTALGIGDGPTRWLLVYDDADDPEALRGLLPVGGSGHVVITSRHAAPAPEGTAAGAAAVEVPPMSLADGVSLLTRRYPLLPRRGAEALVERLGREPLALRLAALALRARVPNLRAGGLTGAELAEQGADSYLDELPGPPAGPVGAALAATLRILAGQGYPERLAVGLARMCGFLSPDGVSLDLLRAAPMVAALAGTVDEADAASIRADTVELDKVIWSGARAGLFDIDWEGAELRIDREVQRLLAAGRPEHDLVRVQRAVLTALAAHAPSDAEVELAPHHDRLGELARHLVPSGAVDSGHRAVRSWLVTQVQHVARYGGREARRAALAIAESVSQRWEGDEHRDRDADLRLRLDSERARLLMELGEHQRAVELQLRVAGRSRERLGREHVRTLLASRTAGRYLRTLGRFSAAQGEDNAAYEGFRKVLGGGHLNTLRAANGVAFSSFLAGDLTSAVQIQRETVGRWVAQAGGAGDNTWRFAANLGFYLRERGSYPEAGRVLERARALAQSSDAPDALRFELRARRNLAVIHRWLGEPHVAHARDREIMDQYLGSFGVGDPETLAAQLALAADECAWKALDRADTAVNLAREALEGYRLAVSEGHPYVPLCQVSLGAFQLAAQQLDAARPTAEEALQGLSGALGTRHPWTLAAAANLLNVLAATEPRGPVAGQADELAGRSTDDLTATHPYTEIIIANREVLMADKPDLARLRPIIVDIPPLG